MAAYHGISEIKKLDPNSKIPINITFDSLFDSPFAAAEGAALATYSFDHYKSKKSPKISINLSNSLPNSDLLEWETGLIFGQAQNLARTLMETPANLLTPKLFAERALELLKSDKVKVIVRDQDWIEDKKMGAFLSVARGSCEPPKFLEIIYENNNDVNGFEYGLVGKGVTFDSGGISLKPSNDMAMMKGDMGGAAIVISTMWALTKLNPKINVVATIPLTENMPSSNATKPGDVVTAMNGKTIEVDNTDAEGRLILADAIYYTSTTFSPKNIIELSTLTGAMDVSLGSVYTGAFVNSDTLFEKLKSAGLDAGDKFWRLPLDKKYREFINSDVADLKNTGSSRAGSCTAAQFLYEFVPDEKTDGSTEDDDNSKKVANFAHLDIAGVMHTKGQDGYISKGMTGRPVRSILNLLMKN